MTARSQAEHRMHNADNYPGTRQLCVMCNLETERCEEDSLWVELWGEDIGPLCSECHDKGEHGKWTSDDLRKLL